MTCYSFPVMDVCEASTTTRADNPNPKRKNKMATQTPNETLERLGALTFGTELEYNHISREAAARAIQTVVGGYVEYAGNRIGYSAWTCTAPDGRVWKCVSDASLHEERSAEVVTPVLRLADMDILQKVVRALRAAGAKATQVGGMHVHVGARQMNATQLGNLVKLFYRQEELIVKGARTLENRRQWTQATDREFLRKVELRHPKTINELNRIWFGSLNLHPAHYDRHRYRTLNLNNLWNDKHTVEFRFFNSTTHAGEVRPNILLCLAMIDKAMTAKAASAGTQRPYDERTAKYDLRTFLLRIGFIGDFFKNPRKHLLGHLGGSAAWKGERRDGAHARA